MFSAKIGNGLQLFLIGLPLLFACSAMESNSMRDEAGWAGGDTDAAADGDTDADADGDWEENDTDPTVPEVETELNYIVPQGAGRYVFIADEVRDSVVIVDSETLEIRTQEVGSRPTHLVPLHTDAGTAVAVINLNSDEVTVLRMDEDENIETVDIPVRPDTNALAPSPDGRFVIAFHDPQFASISGAPATDQEISVLDVTKGKELSVAAAVGMHPWKIIYNEDSTRAFVVTEGGINIVDLENLSASSRTESVSLFESGTYDSQTADIEIVPDGSVALGRIEGSNLLVAAALDASGDKRQYTLSSIPTDLDIAEDGTFGTLVMRDLGSVALFDLPLPEDETQDPFTYVSMEGRQVGLATLSGDGNRILLYTTAASNEMDLRRLTLMDRVEGEWEISSAVLERPIDKVATVNGEDGSAETAVVMHKQVATGLDEKPFGYTLVTLPGLMTKLQQVSTAPGQLLLTPDGANGFLLLPSSNAVDKMDLDSLIVNTLPLSSSPTAAGYAATTDKVFVAQNHAAGRMTFIGVNDDSVKTVTGYNLNDEIEVSK
jgi:DNA-binding beta-propeller fold protein YncE